MGSWPRCAVLSILAFVGMVGIASPGAVFAQAANTADVMLDDVGGGFVLVEESTDTSGALTRTFEGDDGTLQVTGFAVETPPGVRQLFDSLPAIADFEFVDEPALDLARWMVPAGTQLGEGPASILYFASRDQIFNYILFESADSDLDGPAFVLDLARRQLDQAGAPAPENDAEPRAVDDEDLLPYLPTGPPPGYGLDVASGTLTGTTEFEGATAINPEVGDFLERRSKSVTRLWASADLALAAAVTEYPYDTFAASTLGEYSKLDLPPLAPDAIGVRDAVLFRQPEKSFVGVAFRRDDLLGEVFVQYTDPADEALATQLAIDGARSVADQFPGGDSGPYMFPSPISKLTGLALTAGIVIAGVAGSRVVAHVRARRVRRRWASDDAPQEWPEQTLLGTVIKLDDDAARLRRRGEVVAFVQLATIVIGVVALAGDFAWRGVIVGAISLVTGLLFTRWWLRREHALFGPSAPPKAFRTPRLAGALIGIGAFAVLGVGTAYFLKGVRYIIFKPTLAQLKWADLFGVAPRTVGVIFSIGGLLMVVLGAVLWRIARAFGRARVSAVLQSDARPPVLYLRSFDDDSVPLPIIASARRPLFELFSIRGADPFEECVAWELDSYGPVIAVGRPGGSLASLGAAREHLGQSTWHDEIAERMRAAGSIVLAPGETAGLAWELNEIVSGGHLGKTVLVFPPLSPSALARRWEHTADVLRSAGATVGALPAPYDCVHTAQLGDGERIRVTCASIRDEATYRTAVDRAFESHTGLEPARVATTA